MEDQTLSGKTHKTDGRSGRGLWRLIALGVILAGLIAAAFLLPLKQYVIDVLEWTKSLGVWGPVVVAAFYIVACVLMLPGSVITLGAGFLFGVLRGTIIVSIGSTLGACAAFIVGRSFARKWVEQKVSKHQKFSAIDEVVGKQGFKIVLLTRLSPIFPFNLLNYAYGLTKVPLKEYTLASWIGMLPGTIMYVFFGSAARSLTDVATGQIQPGPAQQVFFWVGLAATVIVVVLVTRIARKSLTQAVELSESENERGGEEE